MNALLMSSCVLVLGMSGLCFFGQVFVGRFLPTATAMGVFGAIAALTGIRVAGGSGRHRRWAAWSGAAGVLAVAADVANYYTYLAIPGNYYPWFMFGPYAAALALIAAAAATGKGQRPS
jgi:hypothetical protein